MSRNVKVGLILLALVALVFGMNVAASSSPNPITSKYFAPDDVDAHATSCTTIEVEWDNSAHADFSVVRYSTNSDFSDSDYVRADDYATLEDALRAEGVEVDAEANDRVYFKVAQADSEGHRLSPYSKVDSALTPAC